MIRRTTTITDGTGARTRRTAGGKPNDIFVTLRMNSAFLMNSELTGRGAIAILTAGNLLGEVLR
jgi:hypothetical protein